MTQLPAKLLQRIAERMVWLGSDNNLEVIAAAHGIRKLLRDNHCTFEDLAGALQQLGAGKVYKTRPIDQRALMCQEILDFSEDRLQEHEARYIHDILARFEADENYELTEAQSKWFGYLYARYGGGEQ